jgi:hypothetical protein
LHRAPVTLHSLVASALQGNNMKMKILGLVAFALPATFAFGADARAGTDIVLLANGSGVTNDYPAEQLPASFGAWCVNCFPTVKLALVDAKTGVPQGFLYAWGQNVVATPQPIGPDSTFCFDEFVIWQLPSGEIHTVSTRGPCGTYMDKTLVPPVVNPNATVVAGGGQGVIVSGTKQFRTWSGTYVTRVFVEDLGVLQFSHYDYLFVSITGSSRPAE